MQTATLRSNYLFESFSDTELKTLKGISTLARCDAGNILFYEGDNALTLHVILKGSVRVYKCDAKGNEIVMGQFAQGDMIAEMPCFEHGVFPASARCEEVCEVLKIDYRAFERTFLSNPEVSMKLLKSMAMKIKQLEATISRNMTMDATQKVARFICEHSGQYALMKQKEVAALLTMAPETLSRVLKRLTEQGALRGEAGRYEIADEAMLRSIYAL